MSYEPLIVTAHTPAGWAASDPWSPSLDGILAYWALREQLGEETFALGASGHRELVEPDLPVARVEGDGTWWWAASSPIYASQGEHLHFYHRRFDSLAAERFLATERTGRVLTSAGPYKSYRQAHAVRIAPRCVWHVVGDGAAIERLLRRCRTIGAGWSRGPGLVMAWEVRAGGDAALARHRRPLPLAYAAGLGLTGPVLDWALRPPGWARQNRCLCMLPDQGEQRGD